MSLVLGVWERWVGDNREQTGLEEEEVVVVEVVEVVEGVVVEEVVVQE